MVAESERSENIDGIQTLKRLVGRMFHFALRTVKLMTVAVADRTSSGNKENGYVEQKTHCENGIKYGISNLIMQK